MGSVYSILALKDVVVKIPLYALIALSAVALIAFIVGFVKGFRRVSWGGFFWLVAGIATVLVLAKVGTTAPFIGDATGNKATVLNFVWTLMVIGGSVLASLLIYGILGAILRPKMKWSKKKKIETDDYGFEYEIDDDCDDPEDVRRHGRTLVKKGYGKPNILTRILGGLFSAVNASLVVALIFAIGILLVDATGLRNGPFGEMFKVETAQKVLQWTRAYALDFASIGLIFLFTYRGWKTGFLSAIRSFIVTIGAVALIGFSFVIPFHASLSKLYFFNSLINRCTALFTSLGEFNAVAGKILAGLFIALFAILCVVLLNLLLKVSCRQLETGFVRVVDGSLGCIIGILVGTVIVVAIWAVLYALNHFGIFYVSEIFESNAPVSKAFFEAVEVYVKPLLEKVPA